MTKNFIETFINGGNLCILIAKLEMIEYLSDERFPVRSFANFGR